MNYINLKISVEHQADQTYRVSLSSSQGEVHDDSVFPYDNATLQSKLAALSEALLTVGPRAMGRRSSEVASTKMTAEDITEFGEQLFDFLFSGERLATLRILIGAATDKEEGLRLQLRFSENAANLAAIPWEFLRDKTRRKFLTLNNRTSLVRYLDLSLPIKPLSGAAPIKILGMVSNPLNDLNVDQEKNRVVESLKTLVASGRVTLTWLEGDTIDDLQSAIRRGEWDVFHYIGHGNFDENSQMGNLQFNDGYGGVFDLPAVSLARLLEPENLKLVVLNSCKGAESGKGDIFSSTAATLLNSGVLATLAMQYPISDKAAIELARIFYLAVSDGVAVDYALADARNMINLKFPDSAEWATPVLYMRSNEGRLIPRLEPVEEPVTEPVPNPIPTPVPVQEIPAGWDDNNVLGVKSRQVRKFMEEMFTLEELRTICQDVGISHENLAAPTKGALARELIDHCRRHRKSDELLEILNEDSQMRIFNYFNHAGPIKQEGR